MQPALEHVNCAFFANQLHSVGLMPVVFEVPVKMTDERASHLKIGELIGSNQNTWNRVMKTAEDMHSILMKEHLENPDNLRLNLMLSAILNNTQNYAVAKGVCLAEYLVKHGLKVRPGFNQLTNKLSDDVCIILKQKDKLATFLIQKYSQETEASSTEFIACWIRDTKEHWPLCVVLLVAAEEVDKSLVDSFVTTVLKKDLLTFHLRKCLIDVERCNRGQ